MLKEREIINSLLLWIGGCPAIHGNPLNPEELAGPYFFEIIIKSNHNTILDFSKKINCYLDQSLIS
jgi:hypothetical protein